MICSNCGNQVADSAKNCGYCGHPLKREGAPRETPRAFINKPVVQRVWIFAIFLWIFIFAAVGVFLVWESLSSPPAQPTLVKTQAPAAPAPTNAPTASLPTATAKPTKTAQDPNLLLYDDFTDPQSGWAVFGGERSQVGYFNGNFRIAFNQSQCGFDASWSLNEYEDFAAETVFSVPANIPDVGAGLTFRARNEPNQWYLFWVYPAQGKYAFAKSVNNQTTELAPPTASTSIRPLETGGRYRLKLKVEARGPSFKFWIAQPASNYNLLAELSDAELSRGRLGPAADCPETAFIPPAEIFFEWIKIYK